MFMHKEVQWHRPAAMPLRHSASHRKHPNSPLELAAGENGSNRVAAACNRTAWGCDDIGKENPFSLQSARCERLGQSSCGVPSIIYKQTPCCCRTVELLLMEHGWPESRQSGPTKINVRGYQEMRCKPWKTSAHVLAAGKRPTAALLTHGPEFE